MLKVRGPVAYEIHGLTWKRNSLQFSCGGMRKNVSRVASDKLIFYNRHEEKKGSGF